MGNVLSVISGKGGTGKSTFTVNCGAALALSGHKVLAIDTDAGLRSLDLLLHISDQVIYDLADALRGRCPVEKAVLPTPVAGLSVLPAPATDEDFSCMDDLPALCQTLRGQYDFVFLDSPAGLGGWADTAAAVSDLSVLVVTPDPVSVRDADRAAGRVLARGASELRLVINRVQPRLLHQKLEGGLDAVIDATSVQLLGVVPEDRQVALASYEGAPVVRAPAPHTGAAGAFWNIARRLLGEDVPLLHV